MYRCSILTGRGSICLSSLSGGRHRLRLSSRRSRLRPSHCHCYRGGLRINRSIFIHWLWLKVGIECICSINKDPIIEPLLTSISSVNIHTILKNVLTRIWIGYFYRVSSRSITRDHLEILLIRVKWLLSLIQVPEPLPRRFWLRCFYFCCCCFILKESLRFSRTCRICLIRISLWRFLLFRRNCLICLRRG